MVSDLELRRAKTGCAREKGGAGPPKERSGGPYAAGGGRNKAASTRLGALPRDTCRPADAKLEMHDTPAKLLVKAAAFAAHKHRDQRRKVDDIPYVNHPLAVARTLAEEGSVDDAVTLAAAMLHDTVEDTATTREELAREFGEAVAAVVMEVTDDKTLTKLERKRQQVVHAAHLSARARLVKLADKLDNLRDLVRRPPPSWGGERVRGYFCWADAVVAAIGEVNGGLWRAMQAVLATELEVGGRRVRAVPEGTAERAAVLRDYYAEMGRATD